MMYVVQHNEQKWKFNNLKEAQQKFVSQLAHIEIVKAIKVQDFDIHFISPTGEEKLFLKQEIYEEK